MNSLHGLHCDSGGFVVACSAFAAFSLEWLFYRPGRNPGGKASVYLKEVPRRQFYGEKPLNLRPRETRPKE